MVHLLAGGDSQQSALGGGTRLSNSAMFSVSPGPTTRSPARPAGMQLSPFMQLDTGKIGRRRGSQGPAEAGAAEAGKGRVVMFGLINGGVMIPTMVGFASIIYKDRFFEPYLPQAIKLVLLSSAVHQLVFVTRSSLPFAVGQVQDAGLIFMSAISAQIVHNMKDTTQTDPDKVMATTVVVLSMLTALLGMMLVVTGKLKLARLVQYLPLPVVGGYLAFIGLFCGLSGLGLATGVHLESVTSLGELANGESMRLVAPCIAATAVLFLVSKYLAHYQSALPLTMVAMPALFFAIMLVSGSSLQDARDANWVAQATDVPAFYEVFELFDFKRVDWGAAFPSVLPNFFAMFAVVAFGSSLDVAAVQFELGKPMDYDQELVTVGVSNTLSGLSGGYTGSYIFSQTIFTLRNGITSRLCGLVVALVELLLFLAPVDLLSLLPRFFFGSVLLFVAVDLLLEWLVHSWFSLDRREYGLVIITFLSVIAWGLQGGMAIGIAASAIQFALSYSATGGVEPIDNTSSRAVRSYLDRQILSKQRGRIVALRVRGYQFFGTVIGTIVKVQSRVLVRVESQQQEAGASGEAAEFEARLAADRARRLADDLRDEQSGDTGVASAGTDNKVAAATASSRGILNRARSGTGGDGCASAWGEGSARGGSGDTGRWSIGSDQQRRKKKKKKKLARLYRQEGEPELLTEEEAQGKQETRYVVLDLSSTPGIDATAARAAFLTILQSLNNHGIQMVLANVSSRIRKVLRANGVLAPEAPVVAHDDGGLFAPLIGASGMEDEDDLEDPEEDGRYAMAFDTLDEAMQYCEEGLLAAVENRHEGHESAAHHGFFTSPALMEAKNKYFTPIEASRGQVLFSRGSKATSMYVIESGRVDCIDSTEQFRGGSVVGVGAFLREGTLDYTARVARPGKLHALSQAAYGRIRAEDPDLAVELQHALLQQLVS